MDENIFRMQSSIFQDSTRIIEAKALLKYIETNDIKDINIIKTICINTINMANEDTSEMKIKLENYIKNKI